MSINDAFGQDEEQGRSELLTDATSGSGIHPPGGPRHDAARWSTTIDTRSLLPPPAQMKRRHRVCHALVRFVPLETLVPAINNEWDLPVAKNLINGEGYTHMAKSKKAKKKADKRTATKKAAPTPPQ